MSDLLDFCLKLEAMLPDPPDGNVWQVVKPLDPPDPGLVLMLAEWLEDPDCNGGRYDIYRPQMLREMRVDPNGATAGWWVLWAGNSVISQYHSRTDAARELIRRAFELMTMPCPGALSIAGSVECIDDCMYGCSGRGWVPAWVRECEMCLGTGCEQRYNSKHNCHNPCPACHGQKWVKVPEKAHA